MSVLSVTIPEFGALVRVGVFGLPGDKGSKGDKGDQGDQGDAGADGVGATWHVLDTDPDDSLGDDGDLALNRISGDYFRKFSGVYELQGNLKGPDGTAGADATAIYGSPVALVHGGTAGTTQPAALTGIGAVPKQNHKNLKNVRLALAAGNADVMTLGDSIAEGSTLTSTRQQWDAIAVDHMAGSVGLSSPGLGYVPFDSEPTSDSPITGFWNLTGPAGVLGSDGLGLMSWKTDASSQSSKSKSIVLDGLKIFYNKSSGYGAFTVACAGQTTRTIDCHQSAAGPTAAVWDAVADGGWSLTPGAHTITVTTVNTGTVSTFAVNLAGIMPFLGNSSSGVRRWNGGHGGEPSWVPSGAELAQLGLIDPDLVILAWGANDAIFNVTSPFTGAFTVAALQARVAATITAIRGVCATPVDFLVLGTWGRGDHPEADWVPYHDGLYVSSFLNGAAWASAYHSLGYQGVTTTYSDGIAHPNPNGAQSYADVLDEALGTPRQGTSRQGGTWFTASGGGAYLSESSNNPLLGLRLYGDQQERVFIGLPFGAGALGFQDGKNGLPTFIIHDETTGDLRVENLGGAVRFQAEALDVINTGDTGKVGTYFDDASNAQIVGAWNDVAETLPRAGVGLVKGSFTEGLYAGDGTVFDTFFTRTAAKTWSVGFSNDGVIDGLGTPTGQHQAVPKSHTDAMGIRAPVQTATGSALPACTYANGSSGVGATLTANANGAIGSIGGYTPALGERVGVTHQGGGLQDGIYTVTAVGDASHPWILTRSTFFDEVAEMKAGARFIVTQGFFAGQELWLTADVATIGTDLVTFAIANQTVQGGNFAVLNALNAAFGITNGFGTTSVTLADGSGGASTTVLQWSSAGLKLLTAGTDKMALWGATPVVQPVAATDLLTGLINIGARASGANVPLNLGTGALAAGASTLTTLTLSDTLTLADGKTVGTGPTTGTTFGGAFEKLAFFGVTPSLQIGGSIDILTGLITLGLRGSGANPPLNIGTGALSSGAHTVKGDLTLSTHNLVTDTTTGTQIGTGATQKLSLWGVATAAQPAGTTDILAALITLGARASGANPPLNMGTGALTSGTHAITGTLTVSSNIGFNGKTAQALTGIAPPTATALRTAAPNATYSTTGATGVTAGAFDTAAHRDNVISDLASTMQRLGALITDLRANGVVG